MDSRATHVEAGPHRISTTIFGSGEPAVIIEPAFGGNAESWREVAETLAKETTVVTYDRAAYGSSSRALDNRTPGDIARNLHEVLDAAAIARPVVLVGHSAGGVHTRAFTGLYDTEVAGMVLVDSSTEGQTQILRDCLPWRDRLFEAVTLPLLIAVSRKIRSGADRRSMMREHRALKRLTAADQPLAKRALGNRPLMVLTRSPGSSDAIPEDWRRWHRLNANLAQLSANSRHIIADRAGHYIHDDDPGLVIAAIKDVLHSVRTGNQLDDVTPTRTDPSTTG
ncbi:alpha/beta fold hydrolase [Nonomuraea basaltis]|uniref:alpha/beta fold hydrolase n=1 Tax=Nonomuraea basaltis TaxID=2495887 RepID=UPI00110C4156|nr:alpha/beta fold hydrolase [Nonomuraea basaltis]TMR98334.1 alpha/beta hydrolase [Nonomuraea basaltis]